MSAQAERRPREADWDTVVFDDLRPAGNGKDCFYCKEPLGQKHHEACVIRKGAGQYNVFIRENETGEVRIYRNDMAWDEDSEYLWEDGSYGCDCNRDLFFARAVGDPDPEHRGCGHDKFDINIQLPDGTWVYEEFDYEP